VSTRLRVRVIPRAKRSEIAGWRDDALVVRLTAPPVEGAANRLLVRFLAKELGLRPADIEIVGGETARDKVLRLDGLSPKELQDRLGSAS
jgi:uncharacterized protein (TIGR00251 family)